MSRRIRARSKDGYRRENEWRRRCEPHVCMSPGSPCASTTSSARCLAPDDVLVQVKSCGVIPNMNAIFSGSSGTICHPCRPASVSMPPAWSPMSASSVVDVRVGERVYVNPWLSCGQCAYCRADEPMLCSAAAFQGYFGFFPQSRPPDGGVSVRRLLRVHDGCAAPAGETAGTK